MKILTAGALLALLGTSEFAGRSFGAEPITAKQENDNTIRVVAAGKFETTFSKRKGFGSTWFDLKHDPDKKRDLAPVLDENGFFWVKIGRPGSDASWYANPAQEMILLESGPTRVRVRLRGVHAKYGYVERAAQWKESRFTLTFTVYPTGNVYIAYLLEQDEALPFKHFLLITKSTGHWGPAGKGDGKAEVQAAGEAGPEKPSGKTPSPFTLQWSAGPTYFTDILMVIDRGKYPAAYWKEGYQDKDFRTSLDIGSRWPDRTLAKGQEPIHVLMRIADDIKSEKQAALCADDYRAPDRLTVSEGSIDKADEGDRDGDGFNETEGCYVLKSALKGVSFVLHGAKIPRIDPVFKIKDWTGGAPATIAFGSKQLNQGKDFFTSVKEGHLLIQLPGVLKEDMNVVIRQDVQKDH